MTAFGEDLTGTSQSPNDLPRGAWFIASVEDQAFFADENVVAECLGLQSCGGHPDCPDTQYCTSVGICSQQELCCARKDAIDGQCPTDEHCYGIFFYFYF